MRWVHLTNNRGPVSITSLLDQRGVQLAIRVRCERRPADETGMVAIDLSGILPVAQKACGELVAQGFDGEELARALEACSIERLASATHWEAIGWRTAAEDHRATGNNFKVLANRVRKAVA